MVWFFVEQYGQNGRGVENCSAGGAIRPDVADNQGEPCSIQCIAGFMAWLLYGADEDDSLDAYAKALEIAPKDNNVHYQYAVGLLKLDDRNIEEALHHLNIAVELPVADAYQKIVQEKVKEMLIELESN